MRRRDDRGSVMMEAVLVLPIFVLIVFFLIQITFVWTAKQMTYYAAYCGARAAMVYNPEDYGGSGSGVVHRAACTALSWVSWSLSGRDALNFRVGEDAVPLSSQVGEQVSVGVEEFQAIPGADSGKVSGSFPAVTVTVTFDCPLFIPFGGPVIAYFFGASRNHVDTSEAVGLQGFTAANGRRAVSGLAYDTQAGCYSIPLQESCTLAKPYRTDTFPRVPAADKAVLGLN